MESVADSTGYELRVLHAAADGVEPALLLSAPGKKAEYLLNVPDGFSRLALEHKSTPSARLSCILLTSLLPAATGGLGGLMLRLRHDGHGQVQMIGPCGMTAIVHSLRHICRWRHPKVFVSECCGNRPLPIFEDEHIVIVPIVDGDQITGCPWCLYGDSENANTEQQKQTMDLLSGASRSNACSTCGSSELSVSSESGSSSDEEISSDLGGSKCILHQRRKKEDNLQPSDEENKFFKHVRLKLDKSKSDRINVCGVLPGSKQPPANRITCESDVLKPRRSCTQEEEKETRDKQFKTGDNGFETSRCGEQPICGLGAAGGKEVQQNSDVSSMKRFDWLINNSQEVELPDVDEETNPVFQFSPSPDKLQDIRSRLAQSTGSPSVLGYIFYLRKMHTAVLIVDCKSKEHLESIRAHPLLRCSHGSVLPCQGVEESKAGKEHLISAVVDLSPRSIILSRDHELWVESLRSSAPHVVVKGAHAEFGFQSSLATLAKLSCIHKTIFPLPPSMDDCSKIPQASSKQAAGGDEKVLDATLCMRLLLQKSGTLLDYSLCPVRLMKLQEERRQMLLDRPGTDRDEFAEANGTPSILSANSAAAAALRRTLQQRRALNVPSYPSLESFHSRERSLNTQQEGSVQSLNNSEPYTPDSYRTPTTGPGETSSSELGSDFQLVFFGTGCAEPSKKRGSSGILLQVRGSDRAMLMEAGEGVAGQFVRTFGQVKAQTFICSLECLWLSHKHGDHVLGVLSILEARRKQNGPLVVIGPQKVGMWLSEVKGIRAAMGCPVPEYHFIPCQDVAVYGRFLENREDRKHFDRVLTRMQLQSLRLIRVFHCFDAYGIILRGKSGWSIVYSGDTRPCKPLEHAGQGCSLLIHEATFEDELIEQARQKRHCTVSEAIKAGMQMGAHHIILTHFSQRYPEMVAMCRDQNQRVSVAFDGMVVPSHLLESLCKLLPLITSVFEKVDKTASFVTGQVMHEEDSNPTNHLPLTQAKTLNHSSNEELEDDGTGSLQLAAASVRNSLRLNTECEDCAGAKAKHIRWSNDEVVEGPPGDLAAETTAIKWSSDSDEEEIFLSPVFKCRSRAQDHSVENDEKAVAVLARGPSLVRARETSFDTVVSSATKISAEDEESACHPFDRPRRYEYRTVSRRASKKKPRNITSRDEIETSVDQFLNKVQRYDEAQFLGLYNNGEESLPSPLLVQGTKAQGGTHIRWIDSDTE